jgi:eukaryotic-like serine/threonine-protein kinase
VSVNEAIDSLIGKTLNGRFEIVAPLGVGGMGKVYKAIQHPLDRIVALKVLNPRYDGTRDPGFERRFFLEASMTAKLSHPNTITVHDYGRTDDGIYFIAMEYLQGETLQQMLAREKRLEWPRALFLGAQVARSLREAHKLNLVHRDLKPANIMLMSENSGGDVVKVLDFGLVKSFELDPEKSADEPSLTQAGMLLGSPLYMAPEQAKHESDGRSDIYSLGVVLFQCIAGRPPFISKDSIDVIIKHVKEAPPELVSLAPDITAEVNNLVMRCLKKAPIERFQSMDELLEAMRGTMVGLGMSGIFSDPRVSSAVIPRTMTPDIASRVSAVIEITDELERAAAAKKAPSSKIPLVVASILAALVLAGGLFFLNIHTQTPPSANLIPSLDASVPQEFRVLFVVRSVPSGATVKLGDVTLGTTPLTHLEKRMGTSPLTREFSLTLDGFQPTSVVAQGIDGEVKVQSTLVPIPVAPPPVSPKPKKPPPKKNSKVLDPRTPGYKEDPYR